MAIVVNLNTNVPHEKSINKYIKLLTVADQNATLVNRILNRYNTLQRAILAGYLTVTGN